MTSQKDPYPVRFSVDYPDRPLNRVATAFRIFVHRLDLHSAGDGRGRDLGVVARSRKNHRGRRRRTPVLRAVADDPVPSEVPALVVRPGPRTAAILERQPTYASPRQSRIHQPHRVGNAPRSVRRTRIELGRHTNISTAGSEGCRVLRAAFAAASTPSRHADLVATTNWKTGPSGRSPQRPRPLPLNRSARRGRRTGRGLR